MVMMKYIKEKRKITKTPLSRGYEGHNGIKALYKKNYILNATKLEEYFVKFSFIIFT